MTPQIAKLNTRLGQELGRTVDGHPKYRWMWSEDPRLMHPMRVPEKYDFVANPETGIIAAQPVYALRKMCVSASQQWVLCHWIDSPPEAEWRKHFGYSLEWPKGGQYYPTTVALDPGVEPCLILTQTVIDGVRKELGVKGEELERKAEEAAQQKETARKSRLYDRIRDDLPTYDHIAGVKDQVSYPSWGAKDSNANDHSEPSHNLIHLPA